MGSTYILEGSSSDLSASNVGKRVEVTGTVDHAASSSSSTPSSTGSTGSSSASSSMSGGEHLKVSSVRVVGSDCGSGK